MRAAIDRQAAALHKGHADLRGRIASSTVSSHRPLVESARCAETVHAQLTAVDDEIASICHAIPAINYPGLGADPAVHSGRLTTSGNALSQHLHLAEVLDIPKLMDTLACIVQDIEDQVGVSCSVMLSIILRQLRGEVHLPDCLRYVSFMRRLRQFNEQELRWNFLACRDCWFEQQSGWVGMDQPVDDEQVAYARLVRMIDTFRLHGFRIATQYRAIFREEDSGLAGWVHGGLLHGWAVEKLSILLSALHAHVARYANGARHSTLLSQFMYAGSALGRAGIEFRPLLPGIFEPSLLNVFARKLDDALNHFRHSMDRFAWVRIPCSMQSRSLKLNNKEDGALPVLVVQFPPLALLLNGILDALNDIRVCAPSNIGSTAAQSLKEMLLAVAQRIMASASDEHAEDTFVDFCQLHTDYVLPYVVWSFESLFRGETQHSVWDKRSALKLVSLRAPLSS